MMFLIQLLFIIVIVLISSLHLGDNNEDTLINFVIVRYMFAMNFCYSAG